MCVKEKRKVEEVGGEEGKKRRRVRGRRKEGLTEVVVVGERKRWVKGRNKEGMIEVVVVGERKRRQRVNRRCFSVHTQLPSKTRRSRRWKTVLRSNINSNRI